MDGIAFAGAARTDEGGDATAMILLASVAMRGDARRAFDAGYAGYIVKPVHTANLRDTVAVVVGRQEARASGEESARLVTRHTIAEQRPGRTRVLLVEDNPTNQQVVQVMLSKLGIDIDLAENGQTAIDLLRNSEYDLVLMDCQMPVMDGYTATRRIRQEATGVLRPGVPIVAMTAHAMAGEREKCLAAGMNDHITKPVSSRVLAQTVARWTGDKPPPAQDDATAQAPAKGQTVFDRQSLIGLVGAEAAGHTLDVFRNGLHQQLAQMRAAADNADLPTIRAVSHSLKGGAATVGAPVIAERAREIERLATAGLAREVAPAVAMLAGDIEDFERTVAAESPPQTPEGDQRGV